MSGQNDYRRPERHSLGSFLYRGLEIIEASVPEASFLPAHPPLPISTHQRRTTAYAALRLVISRQVSAILHQDTPITAIEQVTSWRMAAIELAMLPLRDGKSGPCFANYFSVPERVIYAVYFRQGLQDPQISAHARRKKVAGYLNQGIPNGQKGWGFRVGQIRTVAEARHPRSFVRAYRAFRQEPALFEQLFTVHFQLTYDYVNALDAIYWRAVESQRYGRLSGRELVEAIDRRENLLELVLTALDHSCRRAA